MASSSASSLAMELSDAGKKLLSDTISVDELRTQLENADNALTKMEQSSSLIILSAMSPSIKALTKDELLNHRDVTIQVLVASCLCEIIRITAPEAPFVDEKMKAIFRLIVSCFKDLSDISSQSYARRVKVLETLHKVRFCVVMLDLEMESLITEMFVHFLNSIRDYHPEDVFSSMEQVMTLILEESDDISGMLSPMLATLRTENQNVLPIARRLSKTVFENCATKLKPYLLEAISSNALSLEEYIDVVAKICGANQH